jgi:hypothetical protein
MENYSQSLVVCETYGYGKIIFYGDGSIVNTSKIIYLEQLISLR